MLPVVRRYFISSIFTSSDLDCLMYTNANACTFSWLENSMTMMKVILQIDQIILIYIISHALYYTFFDALNRLYALHSRGTNITFWKIKLYCFSSSQLYINIFLCLLFMNSVILTLILKDTLKELFHKIDFFDQNGNE